MMQIINGKRYNTETATLVCGDVAPAGNYSRNDFKYEETCLYITKKGNWFVAGRGGPMSRWARSVGNMTTGGGGIEPINEQDARSLLEVHGTPALVEQYFGDTIEDA